MLRQDELQAVPADTADALFLPPCVLKARRKRPHHWARPERGWRPHLAEVVSAPALPEVIGEDLGSRTWGGRRKTPRALTGEVPEEKSTVAAKDWDTLGSLQDGECLAVGDEDDPEPYEVLSAEESQDKAAIWDEVNHEIMPMLEAMAQRRKRQKQEELKEQEQEEERWHAELQLRKARQANRDAQKRPLKEDRTEPVGVLDDLFEAAEEQVAEAIELDFWKEHAASSRASTLLGDDQGAVFGKVDPSLQAQQAQAQHDFVRGINELFGKEDPRRKLAILRRRRGLDTQLEKNLDSLTADAEH